MWNADCVWLDCSNIYVVIILLSKYTHIRFVEIIAIRVEQLLGKSIDDQQM